MKKYMMAALSALILGASAFAQNDNEQQTLADKLYVSITQAQNSQDWPKVAELVEQILAAGEDISDYEVAYAQALSHQGRSLDAIKRLEAYLPAHDTDFMAYQTLGDIYASTLQTEKAAQAYQKCGELRPDFARPFVSLGRLYAAEDTVKAMENYNKAIRIFLQAQRPDAAIQIGLEAMKVDQTDMRMLLLMGDALTDAGMTDNALSFYAAVLAQAPKADDNSVNIETAVEANFSIAMVYYRRKEYKESLKYLEKMYESEPLLSSDAKAFAMMLCLGAADRYRLGNNKAADKLLDKAKKYDPNGYRDYYNSILTLTAE